MKEKKIVPVKTRLEKPEFSLFSFNPKLFDVIDKVFNIPRILDKAYLKRLFKKKYQLGLDIGAGKGSTTEFLLKYANKATCLDKEKKELVILKKRMEAKGDKVSSVVGDAKDLPFKDLSFDLIFSNCVLEHIKEDEKVLAEIGRCLKPRGSLIMTFPNKEMKTGWFKSLVFNHPSLRFLVDPSLKKYFSFKNIKEAEKWYALYRWQHVRRGYSLTEIRKRLARYNLRVQDVVYYPSKTLTEFWEIITFSRINSLFPYALFVFVPFFHLLPKEQGDKKHSLEFGILAQKVE